MIIGSDIQFYKTLTSTNNKALSLLKMKEIPEGTVICADFQTAGKGQRGNKWESDTGMNLLISIILYPGSVCPVEQFLISMTIALGIIDFTEKYYHGSSIKWPNDIYIKNDKIAGILIENSIMGEKIESSVAGIGYNINQDKFGPGITNPVSLKMITGRELDTGVCLRQMLADLDIRYKHLLYGERESIRNEYSSRLYRSGEWHAYRSAGILFEGKIRDVSPSGKLRIEEKNGRFREFSFRELDYIK
jgi:BirA family biotin operon repressor/biotin-[acetyl-CoA-carboxylase] ligase